MLLLSETIPRVIDCLFNLLKISTQTQHLIKQRKDALIAFCNLYEQTHWHDLSPFSTDGLLNKLIDVYRRCAHDYTNDRLGDSGRLVRETACTQLVRLFQLINENSRMRTFLNSTIQHQCLNSLLTNLCSKIDDLRVISGRALANFLAIPFEQPIEHRDELRRLFLDSADIDWRNSQSVFPLIVQLLTYDKYRFTIWLNCLIAAGESTGASQALHAYLILQKANHQLIHLLFQDLEKIFHDKQHSQMRILLPCVQACERLLSQSTFENYFARHPQEFVQHWKTIVRLLEEILGKKAQTLNNNPTAYTHFIKLYCSILQFSNAELKSSMIKVLSQFFLHSYPWVRRQAAQNFYETCVMFNDDLFLGIEDQADEIMNLLTETDWEANLDQLTTIRQTVLHLFRIAE